MRYLLPATLNTTRPFLRMLADRTSRFTSAGFAQSSAKSSGGILPSAPSASSHRLHDRCLFSDPSKDGWIAHGCGAAATTPCASVNLQLGQIVLNDHGHD